MDTGVKVDAERAITPRSISSPAFDLLRQLLNVKTSLIWLKIARLLIMQFDPFQQYQIGWRSTIDNCSTLDMVKKQATDARVLD